MGSSVGTALGLQDRARLCAERKLLPITLGVYVDDLWMIMLEVLCECGPLICAMAIPSRASGHCFKVLVKVFVLGFLTESRSSHLD